jgi:SAM-dependent methyltransferase
VTVPARLRQRLGRADVGGRRERRSIERRLRRLGGNRSVERLVAHYEVERELAQRLRDSTADERAHLYAEVYDELFRRVPDHPMLTRDVEARTARTAAQLRLLRPFLRPDVTFLEIGAGDCSLCVEVAKHVKSVLAVEVSSEITGEVRAPANFSLLRSNGLEIPIDPGTIDLAYSDQLMEHLHPEDAAAQLADIHAALRPGGVYVFVTPNRLTGPHDISKYFEAEARGLHLKEYTLAELLALCERVGFSSVRAALPVRGTRWVAPRALLPLERVMGHLPRALVDKFSHASRVRHLFSNSRVAAVK